MIYSCKLKVLISVAKQIPSERIHEAFTSKSTYASGELIYSPIAEESAKHIRDAFVKGMYGRLFIWIVSKINASLSKPAVSFFGNLMWTSLLLQQLSVLD